MKPHTIALLMLAALGAAPAQAQTDSGASLKDGEGLILFSGGILDQTCKVDTSQQLLHVELPFIGRNSLTQAGDTAGATPFQITLTDCKLEGEDLALPYLHFQGNGIDTETGNLKNLLGDDGASNVQVQLLSHGIPVPLDVPDVAGAMSDYQLVDGDMNKNSITLRYQAQYFATGMAQPGPVVAMVNYVIAYH